MFETIPVLAVSISYCLLQAYRRHLRRHQRVLRERVTYLLWVMAHADDADAEKEF